MTLVKQLKEAFQREGTTIMGSVQLVPAAMKEIARIKADGNKLGFIKDDGRWYADLQHWPLDRHHLLMVAGADTLLDEMNDGSDYVNVKLSQHKESVETGPNEALLELIYSNGVSGTYKVHGNFNTRELWLCPVVNFVFMRVPKFIKFSKQKPAILNL